MKKVKVLKVAHGDIVKIYGDNAVVMDSYDKFKDHIVTVRLSDGERVEGYLKDDYDNSGLYNPLPNPNIKLTKQVPWTVVTGWRKNENGDNDYEFILAAAGKKRILVAGCQNFDDLEYAYQHWDPVDGAYAFATEDEGRQIRSENSLKLLKRLEKKVEA